MQRSASFALTATDIEHSFQRRRIFSGVSLSVSNNQTLGVTGRNGSGKSTLLRILSNLLSPSRGTIQLSINNTTVQRDSYYRHIGFVSPYLALYEEFTAMEHARINARLRAIPFDEHLTVETLAMLRLDHRRHDDLKTYSSGMKQRMKYALALLHSPALLLLDEPMTNLDQEGTATVEHIVALHRERGGGVIIATNDERDKALCDTLLSVESQEKSRPYSSSEQMS